jgi:hypothetical protein
MSQHRFAQAAEAIGWLAELAATPDEHSQERVTMALTPEFGEVGSDRNACMPWVIAKPVNLSAGSSGT